MKDITSLPTADRDANKIGTNATPTGDRLLGHREVMSLLGYRCRTAHTALNLARQGKIEAVRISARCIRYRESSVHRLINGGAN